MIRRSLTVTVAACLLVILSPGGATAETVFFDDFSDGSVTNDVPLDRDGNPVMWVPLAACCDQGTGDASTGDYVLTTKSSSGSFASLPSHAELTDTSVRAEMQLTAGRAAIAVLARLNTEPISAYQAGISNRSGNTNAYIAYNQPNAHVLALEPASVDVTSGNVVIQFDVTGQTLRLFTWNAGEEKPATPALEVIDSRFSSGVTGVLLDSDGGPAAGVFRYVHVADAPIPEPSSIVLAGLACVGLLTCRGRSVSRSC